MPHSRNTWLLKTTLSTSNPRSGGGVGWGCKTVSYSRNTPPVKTTLSTSNPRSGGGVGWGCKTVSYSRNTPKTEDYSLYQQSQIQETRQAVSQLAHDCRPSQGGVVISLVWLARETAPRVLQQNSRRVWQRCGQQTSREVTRPYVLCTPIHGLTRPSVLCTSIHGLTRPSVLCTHVHGLTRPSVLCTSIHGLTRPLCCVHPYMG